MAARRVGPGGYVLAVDISANMLKGADESAREAGLTSLDTRVMNAEKLDLIFLISTPCEARSGHLFVFNQVASNKPEDESLVRLNSLRALQFAHKPIQLLYRIDRCFCLDRLRTTSISC
jgi:hypothetical protein